MESLVKLTVKTPNQGFEDIQINCELDWTVRKLKEYLQDVYPSKPSSSSQRLIYLGRLLQDHLSLKEVFGEWGARTLHIVCNDMTETMPASVASTSTTIVTPTVNSAPAANPPGMDGLRYRGFTSTEDITSNPAFMGASTSLYQQQQYIPALSPYMQPQSAEVQQMQSQLVQQYQLQMQQYYRQMYQWQQSMGGNQWAAMGGNQWATNQLSPGLFPTPPNTPSFSTSSEASSPQLHPQTTPHPQPRPQQYHAQAQQADQQQQQQAQADVGANQINRNVRLNAGPGGAMQDEDDDDNENPRNRDWLDWLYTSLRAFMLLSIVYFYSSTSRFIMVTILAFLLYLYQNGWFTPGRVPQPPQPPQPGVVEEEEERRRNNENDGQPQNNGEQVNPEQDSDNNSRGDEEQSVQNEPPRPNPLRTLCTFCVSFVTSLIPNPPAIGQQ